MLEALIVLIAMVTRVKKMVTKTVRKVANVMTSFLAILSCFNGCQDNYIKTFDHKTV